MRSHTYDTVVTWTLTPTPSGTRLELEHTGFVRKNKFAFDGARQGHRLRRDDFEGVSVRGLGRDDREDVRVGRRLGWEDLEDVSRGGSGSENGSQCESQRRRGERAYVCVQLLLLFPGRLGEWADAT